MYVLLSYSLLKQKKIQDAEDVLLKALDTYPSTVSIKTSLVNVYDIQGKNEETQKLLKELIASDPENLTHKLAYS